MLYSSQDKGIFNTLLPISFHKKYTSDASSVLFYNHCLPYIPYTGCVLEYVLYTSILTNNEKLFYLLADSLSLINGKNSVKQRSIAISSSTWAEKLRCSKTEVFSLQKSLEEKGYFIIIRDTNKSGKNKRNVIIPTIPDFVFNNLRKEPDRFNSNSEDISILSMLTPISTTDTSSLYVHANKRTYLDKTKLFIRLNYKILSIIISSSTLNSFAKIVWLDFYSKCYKNHMKSKNYFAFTCSYQELENGFGCSRHTISRALLTLEEYGFIQRTRFHVKNDNEYDNLHDRSLWNITVTLPYEYQLTSEQLYPHSDQTLQGNVAKSDPYCADFGHIYNKDFILNNNLDTVDNNSRDFVKPSYLSESFKNNNLVISSNSISSRLGNKSQKSNFSSLFPNKVIKSKLKSNTEENRAIDTNTPVINSAIIKPDNRTSSASGKSLKSFYPLSKEQVDKLNSLSGREFSSNFTNQLLLKLYSRDTSKTFLSENHMMAYMRKALAYEKHQAPLVNHESFQFAVNLSEEDKRGKDIEKYLTEVESSSDTSYSSQLKRKIAGSFENNLAYQLLTKARFEYQEPPELIDDSLEDQEILKKDELGFLIALPKNLLLTEKQQEILENTITSVYGYVDIAYEITKNSNIQSSDNLQSKGYLNNQADIPNYRRGEKVRADQDNEKQQDVEASSIWYKIRQELKEELGAELDKTWFSKLTAEENGDKLELILYAPSNFYRDWINNHYSHVIRRCCIELGYSLMSVEMK